MRNLLGLPTVGLPTCWSGSGVCITAWGFRTSKVQSRNPCSWSQQQPLCGWLHSNRQDKETDLCAMTRRFWTQDNKDSWSSWHVPWDNNTSRLRRKTARLSCRWQWQSRQQCWLWHLEKEPQLESVQVKMEDPEQVLISRAGEEWWWSDGFRSQPPTASAKILGERGYSISLFSTAAERSHRRVQSLKYTKLLRFNFIHSNLIISGALFLGSWIYYDILWTEIGQKNIRTSYNCLTRSLKHD